VSYTLRGLLVASIIHDIWNQASITLWSCRQGDNVVRPYKLGAMSATAVVRRLLSPSSRRRLVRRGSEFIINLSTTNVSVGLLNQPYS
jgi:hypothetical protein